MNDTYHLRVLKDIVKPQNPQKNLTKPVMKDRHYMAIMWQPKGISRIKKFLRG